MDRHDIARRLESIQRDLSLQQSQLSTLQREILEVCDKAEQRIDRRLKFMAIVIAIVMALGGSSAFYWLRISVPQMMSANIQETTDQIAGIRDKAEEHLKIIEDTRARSSQIPLIVLQTDYGSSAYYMAALKGVIYHTYPEARIDVITSEVPNFNVRAAAWILLRASRNYPTNTVFVSITNPGGLTSNPVVIKTKNGFTFIGHNNGCFDMVIRQYGLDAIYTIASPDLSPLEFKDMFGGVDLFGPTAAKIACGFPLQKVGPKSTKYVEKLANLSPVLKNGPLNGIVELIDKFGNVTTNIEDCLIDSIGIRIRDRFYVSVKDHKMPITFENTYGHVSEGIDVAVMYEGYLQLAINMGNFASAHKVNLGDTVIISKY